MRIKSPAKDEWDPGRGGFSANSTDPRLRLRRLQMLAAAVALLVLAFAIPFYELARLAESSQLFSYIPLIPLVSAWLIWTDRGKFRWDSNPDRRLAWIPLVIGLGLAAYGSLVRPGFDLAQVDCLALMMLSFVCLLVGLTWLVLGTGAMRSLAFPLGFLIFCIPFPTALLNGMEYFLQHASADVAHVLFWISGTTFARRGLLFYLPGITIEVAPECSGIHSTWVLFITSVLAGQLFLRSPWKRILLCVAILPLALIRNGIRILTIGELCIHIGPEMIDSYIHRHGGPIFFIASLIPFFYFLRYLRRTETVR